MHEQEHEKNIGDRLTLFYPGYHQYLCDASVLLDDRYGGQACRRGNGFTIYSAPFPD